jgi:hypothetical protein
MVSKAETRELRAHLSDPDPSFGALRRMSRRFTVREIAEVLRMSTKRDHQMTVPLDADLRAFAEQQAAREDRKPAAWIRHLIAEARRQAEQQQPRAA